MYFVPYSLYRKNFNFDGNFELGLLSDHILSYIAGVY